MTSRGQIAQRAVHDDVPSATVERDYVLSHIIAGLGSLDAHPLVFKGGTALRMCYFSNFRYSADLDFTLLSGNMEEAYETITQALNKVIGAFQTLQLTNTERKGISYMGPLGRTRTLKLDITEDELVTDVKTASLIKRWEDLPRVESIPAYSLTEMAGEKLRCVMQRVQCRDLYDLWYLLNDTAVDLGEASYIFRMKAEHRGLDCSRFRSYFEERLLQYRENWTDELANFIPGVMPQYNQVERTVSRQLRAARIL